MAGEGRMARQSKSLWKWKLEQKCEKEQMARVQMKKILRLNGIGPPAPNIQGQENGREAWNMLPQEEVASTGNAHHFSRSWVLLCPVSPQLESKKTSTF